MSEPAKARPFYGPMMLLVSIAVLLASMPGQSVLIALFNVPIREALGLSIATLSLCYTIGTIAAAFPLSFVGRAADLHGLRLVIGAVAVCFGAALFVLGRANGPVTLTLGFFLIRFFGQGSLGMLSGHVLAMWYERRLGVMDAAKTLSFSAGAAILPIPTVWLITTVGWRDALLFIGLGVMGVLLPIVMTVFRNRPEDIGQHLDGDPVEHATHDVLHGGTPPPGDPAFTLREALATRAFWVLTATTGMLALIATAALFQMQPMLASAGAGDPVKDIVKVNMVWPITMALSTLAGGWLVDRVHPRWLMPIGPALTVVSAVLWWAAVSPMLDVPPVATMALGMGVFGLGQGVAIAASQPTLARYFGRTNHGAIRGAYGTLLVAMTGAGPLLSGVGYTVSGERFGPVLLGFAAACVPLTVFAFMLSKPVRGGR